MDHHVVQNLEFCMFTRVLMAHMSKHFSAIAYERGACECGRWSVQRRVWSVSARCEVRSVDCEVVWSVNKHAARHV